MVITLRDAYEKNRAPRCAWDDSVDGDNRNPQQAKVSTGECRLQGQNQHRGEIEQASSASADALLAKASGIRR